MVKPRSIKPGSALMRIPYNSYVRLLWLISLWNTIYRIDQELSGSRDACLKHTSASNRSLASAALRLPLSSEKGGEKDVRLRFKIQGEAKASANGGGRSWKPFANRTHSVRSSERGREYGKEASTTLNPRSYAQERPEMHQDKATVPRQNFAKPGKTLSAGGHIALVASKFLEIPHATAKQPANCPMHGSDLCPIWELLSKAGPFASFVPR